MTSPWFLTPAPQPSATSRLFCLPYAGAGASTYRAWPAAIGEDIEVHAVQLPGREFRIAEPPAVDPDALASALAECATADDRPYAMFGHSMGGRLAFETIRRLRERAVRLPDVLFVSACRPPDLTRRGPLDDLARVSDEMLVARLVEGGGLPPESAAEPELLELVLPALRSDLAWLDDYTFVPQSLLPVPIVAFAGSHDHAVPADQMPGWERHTAAGFTLHLVPGGHFFLHDRLGEVAARIRAAIGGAGRPAHQPSGRPGPRPSEPSPRPPHRVMMGSWSVWRDAILRTTGFPADRLDVFADPACAEAADAYLQQDDTATREAFDNRLDAALAGGAEQARILAADPAFREALAWQNRSALVTLDSLLRGTSRKRPAAIRRREMMVARYWQRYCAKNETIGFFGPVCWTGFGNSDDDVQGDTVRVRPGPNLVRERRTYFEDWALEAVGAAFAADPAIRLWLRPVVEPHVSIRDRRAVRPPRPPVALSAPELQALSASDGTRTAADIVAQLPLPKPADGYLLLDRLVDLGLLRWDADLPRNLDAERVLGERVDSVGDPVARERARVELDRLLAARDMAARQAGDAAAVADALARLDEEFEDVTGSLASRRSGQTYAGRVLCYQDAVRDLDVEFGPALLRELSDPLDLLLRAARWLTAELVAAYDRAFRELLESLAEESPNGDVDLAELWFLAQGMLFGSGGDQARPVDVVTKEFQNRWAELFGLDKPDPPAGPAIQKRTELRMTSAELSVPVAEAFPEPDPRSPWSAARIHSPDLQVAAGSVEAVNNGDYLVVLGEMHAAWATFDSVIFAQFHASPDALVEALEADLGTDRVRVLFGADWPRTSGRLAFALAGSTDIQLGIAPAPGADRDRLVPASALVVRQDAAGHPIAHAPDGRQWPLLEVLSDLLAMHAVDAFKLLGNTTHTPRITVDRLVVSRETWRSTVGETGLATVTGDRTRFLAARRWRMRLGLPERVFVRVGSEIKPTYVDFRAPHYVLSLCAFLRAAHADGGLETAVTITEMLPTPEQAWVPDAHGHRYFSELRIQMSDHD